MFVLQSNSQNQFDLLKFKHNMAYRDSLLNTNLFLSSYNKSDSCSKISKIDSLYKNGAYLNRNGYYDLLMICIEETFDFKRKILAMTFVGVHFDYEWEKKFIVEKKKSCLK